MGTCLKDIWDHPVYGQAGYIHSTVVVNWVLDVVVNWVVRQVVLEVHVGPRMV